MNPNLPSSNPSQLLPPSLLRGGQNQPGQIFQQAPLSQNMGPSAMGADPTVMQQPQPGSQANNPTMPQQGDPQAGMTQPQAGAPGQDPQQLTEAQMILNAFEDRLQHHSKITEKTVSTLQKMLEAGLPVQDPQNGQSEQQ